MKIKKFLKDCPKIDLHRHLDGSIRSKTIIDIAKEKRYNLPTYDLIKIKKYVQVDKNCKSLKDFLKTFEFFYPLLMFPDVMERVAYEASEDAAKDNVKYCEFRFAPILQSSVTYSMEDILKGVLRGMRRAHKDFDIINPVILCCFHGKSERSIDTIKLAIKYKNRGVVGVDLSGDESYLHMFFHKDAFQLAYENKIPITIHAGECGSFMNISVALENLHAIRIGHGVCVHNSEDLYEYFIKKQIPLEICITSNVQTANVKEYKTHPIKKYFDDGLNITINTDDPCISNITLSDELYLLSKYYGIAVYDIMRILYEGINASFATCRIKKMLRERFNREIKILSDKYLH